MTGKWKKVVLCVFAISCLLLNACGGGGGSNTTGTTPANSEPTANAGADQNVATGNLVILAGSGADTDGDLLTYSWRFTSKPMGSATILSDQASPNPTFTADLDGIYVLDLVIDDGTIRSLPDSISIIATTGNSAPVANAGLDQNVATGALVTLTGGGADADGDLLTYSWAFSSVPSGSSVALSDSTAANPTFTVDYYGTYVLTLVVSDGIVNSQGDTITITATGGLSSLVGFYDGVTNGSQFGTDSTNITVELVGASLTITDDAFFSGKCIYTGTISPQGNDLNTGTYQCSDFTSGSWTLSQAKLVDSNDLYISIIKDGNNIKWAYGMSAKADSIISPISIEKISSFVNSYSGINNRSAFLTDSTDFTIQLSGSTLTITVDAFFSGVCIYTGEVSAQGNSIEAGTYQCSDFTSGSWDLRQMKVVSSHDIYISISKDGVKTHRIYGIDPSFLNSLSNQIINSDLYQDLITPITP